MNSEWRPAPLQTRNDYLRRLEPEYYRGRAMVHWSLTVARRQTGWLDERAHAIWREALLHTLVRYRLAAPVYALMPDHVHVLLVGISAESDQRLALGFLRRHTAAMFKKINGAWQKQGYDHVLRENERGHGGFATVAHYIAENPVRAGLATKAAEWKYSGSLIAGWPDLDWRREDFWVRWWKIFAENAQVPPRSGRTLAEPKAAPLRVGG
jgi:REP element-mobilizing transposase RayT